MRSTTYHLWNTWALPHPDLRKKYHPTSKLVNDMKKLTSNPWRRHPRLSLDSLISAYKLNYTRLRTFSLHRRIHPDKGLGEIKDRSFSLVVSFGYFLLFSHVCVFLSVLKKIIWPQLIILYLFINFLIKINFILLIIVLRMIIIPLLIVIFFLLLIVASHSLKNIIILIHYISILVELKLYIFYSKL